MKEEEEEGRDCGKVVWWPEAGGERVTGGMCMPKKGRGGGRCGRRWCGGGVGRG